MSSRSFAWLLASVVLASACGGGGSDGGADAPPSGGSADADPSTGELDPPPPPGGQQLATDEYTLADGEEKYLCYTFDSPDAAKAITKIETIASQSVHHILFVKTMSRETGTAFECDTLISLNWNPIYAVGAGAPDLALPDGVGFRIEAGSQYLIQLHLQNLTDGPVTERAGLNLTYAEDTEATTRAGLYAMGTFDLEIPGRATDYSQTVGCNATFPMNVFAIFPHMHKLGTKLDVRHGVNEDAATQVYAKDPWVFGDQPMDPTELSVNTGDYVESTCHWANPDSDDLVRFGESSDQEMCFTLLFYYPAAQDLAACVSGI